MKRWFFETFNSLNHGKFMVAKFEGEDLIEPCRVMAEEYPQMLIRGRGWDPERHLLVLDLQTGEAAIFKHGGCAPADLEKHKVWVCPMFEPFLKWFYEQDISDMDALPRVIELTDAPMAYAGYRRPGREVDPEQVEQYAEEMRESGEQLGPATIKDGLAFFETTEGGKSNSPT
jgi:hypothetical protein